jgi:hypothetical protein
LILLSFKFFLYTADGTFNPLVTGSNPVRPTKEFNDLEAMPSFLAVQKQQKFNGSSTAEKSAQRFNAALTATEPFATLTRAIARELVFFKPAREKLSSTFSRRPPVDT